VLSEHGLLQFGHSKDDPDRPQVKIAAAALDPLGLPLATAVVPGNATDDPLYIPAIQAVRQSFGSGGRTYVGDCKMAALATRAFVAAGKDFYLCPLSENQISRAQRRELLQGVWEGTPVLERVYRPGAKGQPDELVAEGFSLEVELTDVVDGREIRWTERRWLVRSLAYAQAQETALERRLGNASRAIRELVVGKQGKKQLFHADLMAAAAAIVKHEGVEGLLSYSARADDRAASASLPGSAGAAGDGRVLRDRGAPKRSADRGEEAGDGLADLRHERPDAGVAAGGVGLPRAVSSRGRLVAAEGAASGLDPDVPD
jgi:transposase